MCGPLLLLPAFLVLPVLLLTSAVVALVRLGPGGVLVAVVLVLLSGAGSLLAVRAAASWWRSTAPPR